MASFDGITAGITNEATVTVEQKHTVAHTKVPVLSTPMMIGLMEIVSKDAVQPLLPPGFTTVGFEVNIRHKAAALIGALIKISCKLLEADGRKLLFEIRVTEGEKIIGEGQHRRTIIQGSE
jgi:fluoroacetyl-CoA thioesterase